MRSFFAYKIETICLRTWQTTLKATGRLPRLLTTMRRMFQLSIRIPTPPQRRGFLSSHQTLLVPMLVPSFALSVIVQMFTLLGKIKHKLRIPSRDFSPNLKQDLSGLSGFFGQLRSKSCFKMSGLSGF